MYHLTSHGERIVAAAFPGLASESDVSKIFETGTQTHLPAFALFTGIRTEAALIEQLSVLAHGSRWRITHEHPAGLITDDVMVGVEWQIGNGCASSVMGLAPFATMPVTRRAPYVCLAAWPGGHDNPHWTRYDQNLVHFLDTDLTALQLTTPKYRSPPTRPVLIPEPPDRLLVYLSGVRPVIGRRRPPRSHENGIESGYGRRGGRRGSRAAARGPGTFEMTMGREAAAPHPARAAGVPSRASMRTRSLAEGTPLVLDGGLHGDLSLGSCGRSASMIPCSR